MSSSILEKETRKCRTYSKDVKGKRSKIKNNTLKKQTQIFYNQRGRVDARTRKLNVS